MLQNSSIISSSWNHNSTIGLNIGFVERKNWTPNLDFQSSLKIENIKLQHKRGEVDTKSKTKGKSTRPISADISYFISYGDDLMRYYSELESNYRKFDPDYSELNINCAERQRLVSFIIKILSHNGYPSCIFYPVVRLFDDIMKARRIAREKLELVALTAIWITLKKDLIVYNCPSVEDIVTLSNGNYNKKQLFASEIEFLRALDFEFSYSDPCSILCYCILCVCRSKFIGDVEAGTMFYYGSYMLDLALLDPDLLKLSSLTLGASAAEIAVALKMELEENLHQVSFESWRSLFAWKYVNPLEIYGTRCKFVRAIAQSPFHGSANNVVFKKYMRSRYGGITSELLGKIIKLVP